MAPRRSWDDRWPRYPASVPRPAPGGLATSKQRGAMAATWWSERFTSVLESYGLGGRMQRGRRYARTGQVLSLDTRAGQIAAPVQGSRRSPYRVTISLPQPTAAQWRKIEKAMAAKIGFVAQLLAGELPTDLEDVFSAAGTPLFPRSWREVGADCTCPDWENPCKHIAAVLYVFADRLDADPWLLLVWRGRTREELLAALGGAAAGSASGAGAVAVVAVAPWWPFAPGPLPDVPAAGRTEALPADPPDAVLDTLDPLDVHIAKTPVAELLGPVYETIVQAPAAESP